MRFKPLLCLAVLLACEETTVDPLGCPSGASPYESVTGDARRTWCQRADGVVVGPYRATVGDRRTEDGQYLEGLPDGTWTRYDMSERVAQIRVFSGGVKCGLWQTFAGGMLVEEEDRGDCGSAPPPTPAAPRIDPVDIATLCAGDPPETTLVVGNPPAMSNQCPDGAYAVTVGDRVWSQGQLTDGVPSGSWAGFDTTTEALAWTAEMDSMGGAFDANLGLPAPTGDFKFFSPHGRLARSGKLVAGVAQGPWVEYGPGRNEGSYIDGLRDGTWTAFHDDESAAGLTTWSAGVRNGPFAAVDPDGTEREAGSYVDGERDGAWTFRHPGGELHAQGRFIRGFREGDWTFFGRDGRPLVEARFVDALATGEWTVYEYNPALGDAYIRATYVAGVAHGNWRGFWLDDDTALFETEWAYDAKNGLNIAWYRDGQVEHEGEFRADEPHGMWRWFYPDGALKAEGEMWTNRRVGPWATFWPDGSVRSQGTYRNGQPQDDFVYFDERGVPRSAEEDAEDRR